MCIDLKRNFKILVIESLKYRNMDNFPLAKDFREELESGIPADCKRLWISAVIFAWHFKLLIPKKYCKKTRTEMSGLRILILFYKCKNFLYQNNKNACLISHPI